LQHLRRRSTRRQHRERGVAPHNRKRVTIDVGQALVKQRRQEARAHAASTEDALRDLAERRERGELTDDEFDAQKRLLLGS